MITSERGAGAVGGGQVLAAVGILFGLALTAPLVGLLMVPVAAFQGIARAARS